MSKINGIEISEFKYLLAEATELHENSNDPIPALFKDSLSKVENCLKTPFQNVFGTELYPTLFDKASILMYLFVKNHPLANGNKRMAFITLSFFLYKNGVELNFTDDEGYNFTKKIASSNPNDKDLILQYIKDTIKPNNTMTQSEIKAKIAKLKPLANDSRLSADEKKLFTSKINALEALLEAEKEVVIAKKEPKVKLPKTKSVKSFKKGDSVIYKDAHGDYTQNGVVLKSYKQDGIKLYYVKGAFNSHSSHTADELKLGVIAKTTVEKELKKEKVEKQTKKFESSDHKLKELIKRLVATGNYDFLKDMHEDEIEADKKRTAKPFGWRHKGKGDYSKPTKGEIKDGKDVYFENRPNRSDVNRKNKL